MITVLQKRGVKDLLAKKGRAIIGIILFAIGGYLPTLADRDITLNGWFEAVFPAEGSLELLFGYAFMALGAYLIAVSLISTYSATRKQQYP
jgi:hypothetical protein